MLVIFVKSSHTGPLTERNGEGGEKEFKEEIKGERGRKDGRAQFP
jgi:hypothetical protein